MPKMMNLWTCGAAFVLLTASVGVVWCEPVTIISGPQSVVGCDNVKMTWTFNTSAGIDVSTIQFRKGANKVLTYDKKPTIEDSAYEGRVTFENVERQGVFEPSLIMWDLTDADNGSYSMWIFHEENGQLLRTESGQSGNDAKLTVMSLQDDSDLCPRIVNIFGHNGEDIEVDLCEDSIETVLVSDSYEVEADFSSIPDFQESQARLTFTMPDGSSAPRCVFDGSRCNIPRGAFWTKHAEQNSIMTFMYGTCKISKTIDIDVQTSCHEIAAFSLCLVLIVIFIVTVIYIKLKCNEACRKSVLIMHIMQAVAIAVLVIVIIILTGEWSWSWDGTHDLLVPLGIPLCLVAFLLIAFPSFYLFVWKKFPADKHDKGGSGNSVPLSEQA